MATPYDSLIIKEFDGSFLLGSRILVGKNAKVNWPQYHYNHRSAKVTMTDFFIDKEQSDFWTPYAKLDFPDLIDGTVDGLFEFKTQKRTVRIGRYPIFTSNKADIRIAWSEEKINYIGGIKLQGNILYGEAISKERGRLKILDGKGNSLIFKGESFLFKDSLITSENASLFLQHGEDSITHSATSFIFDRGTKELTLYRNKNHEMEPFKTSYFQVEIDAEKLSWDLDKQTFDFDLVNAKNLNPAVVRSIDYFSQERFKRFSGGFSFHPIVTSIYYANKFGITSFNDEELRAEFNVDIKLVKAAMKMLNQYGFAQYDINSGQVDLLPKAYHYENSAAL
jgi:hypothetical protein